MPTFTNFEDMEAWQKARQLTQEIYAVTKRGAFSRDYGLKDQIRRASVSVMSNIAEGFERGGNQEFIHFLSIAKGSAGEIRSQLYVALDEAYISADRFEELRAHVEEVSRLLFGLITYLKRSPFKGPKFRS